MAPSFLADAPVTRLTDLVRRVEAAGNGEIVASILRLEDDRLHFEVAPGLPPEYRQAGDGFEIGPNTGSCGTAAHRAHPIYVPDIRNDILWAGCPELRDIILGA